MWPFNRDLKKHLRNEKKVKIEGINFVIRKINPLDHAKGLKVMRAQFDTYKVASGERELSEGQMKKMKEHYRDVFFASVVTPKLSTEDTDDSVCVDEIFNDPMLCESLYMEIMLHTYGKKKLMPLYYRAAESLKLIS